MDTLVVYIANMRCLQFEELALRGLKDVSPAVLQPHCEMSKLSFEL